MKKRICDRARRLLPPGLEPEWELKWLAGSLAVIAVFSAISYFNLLGNAVRVLYRVNTWELQIMRPGAVMEPFYRLLPGMTAFSVAVAEAFSLGLGHWLYCRQESRADYRLRLLPDRREYVRRCLAVPLIYLALTAVCVLVLLAVYYAAYLLRVPEECLEPDQWGIFVDAVLGRRQ